MATATDHPGIYEACRNGQTALSLARYGAGDSFCSQRSECREIIEGLAGTVEPARATSVSCHPACHPCGRSAGGAPAARPRGEFGRL